MKLGEAINQRKFTLLDLEGISESLSALGAKVWTIAIAQEKLDEVISNANISKSQLTKVTDRFKTKIHLEATEVDVIIRNRLLNKKEDATQQLEDYYSKNSGKISDLAKFECFGYQQDRYSHFVYNVLSFLPIPVQFIAEFFVWNQRVYFDQSGCQRHDHNYL